MIDQIAAENRSEMALRDRHADRVGKALAEWSGRSFDTGRVAAFRVTGRDRAELAKAFDLLDGHGFVAEEMQDCVKQHRAVAGGEHEAIAVRPGRLGRIEFQKSGEQHGGDVGGAHRQARVAGFGLFHCIHRQ